MKIVPLKYSGMCGLKINRTMKRDKNIWCWVSLLEQEVFPEYSCACVLVLACPNIAEGHAPMLSL